MKALRQITQHLSTPHSPLEPVRSLLECGHVVTTRQTVKRANCPKCKQGARIRQVEARSNRLSVKRALEAGEHSIYVRLADGGRVHSVPIGYRVLRVEVRDVTPGVNGRPTKGPRVCEALEIACDAQSVDYVRAQLLEMGARLDGVVLVT